VAAEVWPTSEFPEIDRAEWFDLASASLKILPGQAAFLDLLFEQVPDAKPLATARREPDSPIQAGLFDE
jgi:predicted NUDIX family NTP pyrophosphohydrolase